MVQKNLPERNQLAIPKTLQCAFFCHGSITSVIKVLEGSLYIIFCCHYLVAILWKGTEHSYCQNRGRVNFSQSQKLCVHAQTNGKRKHFVLIFRPDQKKFVRRVVPLSQLSENILLHKIIFSLIMNQNSRNCYLQFV